MFQGYDLLWLLLRDPLLDLFCLSFFENPLFPACQPLGEIIESDVAGLVTTEVLEDLSGLLGGNLKFD